MEPWYFQVALNFCSEEDKANMAYLYEILGVMAYCDKADIPSVYAPFKLNRFGAITTPSTNIFQSITVAITPKKPTF